MDKVSDKESFLTLWGFSCGDFTINCPPEFEVCLLDAGVDPYDLEGVGKLFNCNVTRSYSWKESYHHKQKEY